MNQKHFPETAAVGIRVGMLAAQALGAADMKVDTPAQRAIESHQYKMMNEHRR